MFIKEKKRSRRSTTAKQQYFSLRLKELQRSVQQIIIICDGPIQSMVEITLTLKFKKDMFHWSNVH